MLARKLLVMACLAAPFALVSAQQTPPGKTTPPPAKQEAPEFPPLTGGELKLGDRDMAAPLEVVEGRVLRHPQDPGREGNLALLVLGDSAEQLREHIVGQILGLVGVVHDRLDAAVHVRRVGDVEKSQRVPVAPLGQPDRLPR